MPCRKRAGASRSADAATEYRVIASSQASRRNPSIQNPRRRPNLTDRRPDVRRQPRASRQHEQDGGRRRAESRPSRRRWRRRRRRRTPSTPPRARARACAARTLRGVGPHPGLLTLCHQLRTDPRDPHVLAGRRRRGDGEEVARQPVGLGGPLLHDALDTGPAGGCDDRGNRADGQQRKDSLSGETLIGSTISVAGLSKGITSNSYGFFSISLNAGIYTFICSNVGYVPQIKKIDLTGDVQFNFEMSPKITTEQAVIISSRKRDANVKNAQMGKLDLSINQIKSIPAFLGEVDVLKTIQLLPGVQSAGEGSSGLYVRGGGPDQNLILLDDAVVYNTGHLFGFFSIFNGDAIKNTSLIKGGMPAQYGGRLSSVLDIAMKEGNDKNFQVEGGIGLIASRLSIQGPVKKNKASFIISARRTYVDALVKPFIKKTNSFSGSGYYFYDLNAKINYKFSEKDHIYLSGYFGKDKFDFVNGKQSLNVHIPWGNATGTFRWNHVFNNRLFSNTTLVYNDYNFNFGANQNNFEINLKSGIKDWNVKQDFDLYPFTNHKVKFGALYTYHTFTPSVLTGKQDSVEFMPNNAQQKYSHEGAVYIQDDWDISDKLKINAGIRESAFQQVGKYKSYIN